MNQANPVPFVPVVADKLTVPPGQTEALDEVTPLGAPTATEDIVNSRFMLVVGAPDVLQ